ncbi:hypothetical protein T492DRAFT_875500 [Pavlovales sp. CCMP2436]|nr:hypothetical protein T492DRAFT_875500 [Pavlovales sp. CCMP2436]
MFPRLLALLGVLAIAYRFVVLKALAPAARPISASLDPVAVRRLRLQSRGVLEPRRPAGSAGDARIGGTCAEIELSFDAMRTLPMSSADGDDGTAAAVAAADGACHAVAHVELEGGVVRWGSSHFTDNAAACCASCRQLASAVKPCNVWVFCAKEGSCGAQKRGECWLKNAIPNATKFIKAEGPHLGWVSGSLFALPPKRHAQPAGPAAEGPLARGLRVHTAGGFEIGLREATASVELLSPLSARDFSFVLPLQVRALAPAA